MNTAHPSDSDQAAPDSEPLVTAESFEEASVQTTEPAHPHPHSHSRGRARRRRRPATQAPTPAQQQAASLARSASRRARIQHATSRLPHYDVTMAWYKSRWLVIIFLLQFALVALAVADNLPVVDIFNTGLNTIIQGLRGNLDPLVIALTTLGDVPFMAAICLVVSLILLIFRRWSSLLFFIVNVLLAVAFIHVLKMVFAIPRPGGETLVALPSSFSFPSAHSFTSLIVLGLVGLLIFRALFCKGAAENVASIPAVVLGVLALLIGLSRIYVGVHWPSDVLAGWLLAGAWLSFASALYVYEP